MHKIEFVLDCRLDEYFSCSLDCCLDMYVPYYKPIMVENSSVELSIVKMFLSSLYFLFVGAHPVTLFFQPKNLAFL